MTVGERLADLTMESTVDELLLERVKELEEIYDLIQPIADDAIGSTLFYKINSLSNDIALRLQHAKEAYNAF